jgi:mono/diheme cytochrome c family protein
MERRKASKREAIIAVWLGLTLGACSGLAPISRTADQGQVVARRSCAGCHAIQLTGTSPDPLAPPFRTMFLRFPSQELETRLAQVARDGHVNMPPIATTPDERRDLAAYIRSLSAQAAADHREL